MSIYFNIPENDVFFRSLENVDVFKIFFFFFFSYVKFTSNGNTINIPYIIDCVNKPTVYQY